MNREKALREYKGKILAYTPSKEDPIVYTIEHFLDIVELQKILNHVDDLQLELSSHGLECLRTFYGFEKLAKLLSRAGGIAEYIIHADDILTWLLVKDSYYRIRYNIT